MRNKQLWKLEHDLRAYSRSLHDDEHLLVTLRKQQRSISLSIADKCSAQEGDEIITFLLGIKKSIKICETRISYQKEKIAELQNLLSKGV